jgi:uncharacterized protein (UPF0303 family)
MSDETTLEALEAQHNTLEFASFDQSTAYSLGTAAADVIRERGLAVAVQIVLGEHVVFKAALGGVSDDTDAWLVGKARTARHFDAASLLIGFRKKVDDAFFAGLDPDEFRAHGGSVPIRVTGEGTVGTITVSGAPQQTDHAIAIEALQRVILK